VTPQLGEDRSRLAAALAAAAVDDDLQRMLFGECLQEEVVSRAQCAWNDYRSGGQFRRLRRALNFSGAQSAAE
jgi:glycosyltransferase A (GT-A) superfamily protein (DUF2064 family)